MVYFIIGQIMVMLIINDFFLKECKKLNIFLKRHLLETKRVQSPILMLEHYNIFIAMYHHYDDSYNL